jgi:hypothetical protein
MPDEPTEPTEPNPTDDPNPAVPTPKDVADKANAPAGDEPPGEPTDKPTDGPTEKALTQAEVDRIVADRLKRERAKYADYDDLKAKAAAADAAADESKTDVEKLAEQLKELQDKHASAELRALRSEVARTKGIPVELLSATTKDELSEQADALLAYAQSVTEKTKPKTPDKPATQAAAKPKEKLRSGAASGDTGMTREEVLAAVLNKRK